MSQLKQEITTKDLEWYLPDSYKGMPMEDIILDVFECYDAVTIPFVCQEVYGNYDPVLDDCIKKQITQELNKGCKKGKWVEVRQGVYCLEPLLDSKVPLLMLIEEYERLKDIEKKYEKLENKMNVLRDHLGKTLAQHPTKNTFIKYPHLKAHIHSQAT